MLGHIRMMMGISFHGIHNMVDLRLKAADVPVAESSSSSDSEELVPDVKPEEHGVPSQINSPGSCQCCKTLREILCLGGGDQDRRHQIPEIQH